MITLKNEKLTIKINEKGAEIKSAVCGGIEYIWEGKEEVWGESCPLLFPICGGLKEDKYTFCGKEYTLNKHGFAKKSVFEVESKSESRAVFLLKSSSETLKVYPFDFELRVIYTISGAAINVEYRVLNKTNGKMYFSIGSHEGFYTPEGIEDYDIIFPEKETLFSNLLFGNLLSEKQLPIIKESTNLPLYDKYFTIDALVFKEIKSRSAVLRNRKTGRAVRVDFGDANYLLLWHKPAAPYICIEPWSGIPDTVGSEYDITKKEGIIPLAEGETYTAKHTITIL